MQCPVCQGEMYDNTTNKKNPKGPDYRCKDKNCKFQLDPDTGEYVESTFGTGVWLPKSNRRALPAPLVPQNNGHSEDLKAKAMLFSYAKDAVIGQIQAGVVPPNVTKEIIATFNEFWQAYKDS